MNNDENMRNFNPNVRSQKYVILSNFTSVAKWGGTLLLSIWCTYNWYLLEVYDLGNMLDTIIGVWKRVENFLESWKGNIFKFFHEISYFWDLRFRWKFLIFSWDFMKKIWKYFLSTTLKKFSTHFQTPMMVCNMFHRS